MDRHQQLSIKRDEFVAEFDVAVLVEDAALVPSTASIVVQARTTAAAGETIEESSTATTRPHEIVLGDDHLERFCPRVRVRDIMSLGHWVYDVDSGQRVFVLVRGEDDVKKVKKV